MQYQILEWDTVFFGITVARINEPDLDDLELSEILSELKTKDVSLVYYPSSRELEDIIVSLYGGILVDRKTTFTTDFKHLNYDEYISTDIVEPFTSLMSIQEIESLSIQSGEYSRFVVDKRISREKFVSLYNIWINRSLQKEIAEEVLVIRDSERIVGMVTLENQNGRGDIGLIAVDRDYRGKQYGLKLVHAAQHWFIKNRYQFGQVVTQGANVPACNLYKKCGYSVESIEYLYHFWL